MVYQRVLVQHIVLPKQYALTYYRQPRNNLLMPIVRKTRPSDNMWTNLRGKISALFVVYYSTRVIRFSSKSHIRNQYTVIAWNININYEQRNINNTTLLLPLGKIPIIRWRTSSIDIDCFANLHKNTWIFDRTFTFQSEVQSFSSPAQL
jgi:hypothetical protein